MLLHVGANRQMTATITRADPFTAQKRYFVPKMEGLRGLPRNRWCFLTWNCDYAAILPWLLMVDMEWDVTVWQLLAHGRACTLHWHIKNLYRGCSIVCKEAHAEILWPYPLVSTTLTNLRPSQLVCYKESNLLLLDYMVQEAPRHAGKWLLPTVTLSYRVMYIFLQFYSRAVSPDMSKLPRFEPINTFPCCLPHIFSCPVSYFPGQSSSQFLLLLHPWSLFAYQLISICFSPASLQILALTFSPRVASPGTDPVQQLPAPVLH